MTNFFCFLLLLLICLCLLRSTPRIADRPVGYTIIIAGEMNVADDDIDDITDTKSSNIETSSESNPSKSTQSTSTELTVQVSNKPSDIIEIQPISDSDEDFVKIEYSK